ncbi:hypothetical protein Ciccas_000473 [Cichlidogyrus casuarinus]|uniref:Phosphatidylinositol transfer protein N-terminal domain-containing protein n=1 Tax=Cichlidogyrus casuarinus TaxID=1844966 RepID=A0ABD2QQ35_9PLAT
MHITEFRVFLPITVDSYQVAQLYTVAEVSKLETGGGQGIKVEKNEPFDEKTNAPNPPLLGGKFTKGQYTLKKYYLEKKVPSLLRKVISKQALVVTEEAWNAYPYCRTVITSDYFSPERFKLTIESYHAPDMNMENAHQLDGEHLKLRHVQVLNIADEAQARAFNVVNPDFNPQAFISKKTGIGPMTDPNWYEKDSVPIRMCAYKLVTVQAKMFGVQTMLENFIINQEARLFLDFHRKVFCLMDNWYGMDMQALRDYEDKTKRELEENSECRFLVRHLVREQQIARQRLKDLNDQINKLQESLLAARTPQVFRVKYERIDSLLKMLQNIRAAFGYLETQMQNLRANLMWKRPLDLALKSFLILGARQQSVWKRDRLNPDEIKRSIVRPKFRAKHWFSKSIELAHEAICSRDDGTTPFTSE